MVFDATFNNISFISWRSVFLGEETGGFIGALRDKAHILKEKATPDQRKILLPLCSKYQ
jgi:homoaconitase/3-isopropylmalate dehydratase large subunit